MTTPPYSLPHARTPHAWITRLERVITINLAVGFGLLLLTTIAPHVYASSVLALIGVVLVCSAVIGYIVMRVNDWYHDYQAVQSAPGDAGATLRSIEPVPDAAAWSLGRIVDIPTAMFFTSISSIVLITLSVIILTAVQDLGVVYFARIMIFVGFALAWVVIVVLWRQPPTHR